MPYNPGLPPAPAPSAPTTEPEAAPAPASYSPPIPPAPTGASPPAIEPQHTTDPRTAAPEPDKDIGDLVTQPEPPSLVPYKAQEIPNTPFQFHPAALKNLPPALLGQAQKAFKSNPDFVEALAGKATPPGKSPQFQPQNNQNIQQFNPQGSLAENAGGFLHNFNEDADNMGRGLAAIPNV